MVAGLLACSAIAGLPIPNGFGTVAWGGNRFKMELTVAGTAPDFYRFPF